MNKKGFTMVEILAVIVLLGVLSIFTVTALVSISNKQKQQNYENAINGLLAGARSYFADNLNTNTVTVNDLITNNLGYADLDDKSKNVIGLNTDINKVTCSDTSFKTKIIIEVPKKISEPNGDKVTYNDCGCAEQGAGNGDKLCTN